MVNKLKHLSQVKPVESGTQLEYSYDRDYSVEFFKKNLVVLELKGYYYPLGAAHGMPIKNYEHINLVTGKFYEFKDLFKENSGYTQVLSNLVGEKIKKLMGSFGGLLNKPRILISFTIY